MNVRPPMRAVRVRRVKTSCQSGCGGGGGTGKTLAIVALAGFALIPERERLDRCASLLLNREPLGATKHIKHTRAEATSGAGGARDGG